MILSGVRPPPTQQSHAMRASSVIGRSGHVKTRCSAILRMEKIGPKADLLLRALLQREARQPGSIVMRAGARKKTVILIGHDDWNDITAALAEMPMA